MPPSGEMRRAIADAVAESKPQKFEGSLKDAASHAKQELKFLLVFLHNSNAADSQRFFTEVGSAQGHTFDFWPLGEITVSDHETTLL